MNLIDNLVNIFKEGLVYVFEREQREDGKNGNPNYMKQTILGCRWRAFWGIVVAVNKTLPRMVKVLAMAIAKHRTAEHEEDRTRTIQSLKRSMSSEDIEKASASTRAFWSNG